MIILKVLIACEESQRICTAFRKLGHEAYSADVQDPSGGHPEWHIKGDALKVINPVSGARWFKEGRKPISLQDDAAEFFMKFINADCDHIAVENPICVMSSRYRKPDQIINPYQFGHREQKKTCLWLKGLTYPGIAEAIADQWSKYLTK